MQEELAFAVDRVTAFQTKLLELAVLAYN